MISWSIQYRKVLNCDIWWYKPWQYNKIYKHTFLEIQQQLWCLPKDLLIYCPKNITPSYLSNKKAESVNEKTAGTHSAKLAWGNDDSSLM